MKLEGAPNFRDLGGLKTRNGGQVRHGTIYRSDNLSRLSDRDLDRLELAGIRLICDLRSHDEIRRIRSRWRDTHVAEFLHLDINGDIRAVNDSFSKLLQDDASIEDARQAMLSSYREMPRLFERHLRTLFERLTTADKLPAVIHCHAGKDRTGFACAMILAALDVPQDEIERDYMATAANIDVGESTEGIIALLAARTGRRVSIELMAPVVTVHADYLNEALGAAAQTYGSLDVYLEEAGGLTPEKRERLHELLLD